MASIEIDGANGVIKSTVSDSDLTIKGNDGGSEISALTFDMSAAGNATFNGAITANAGVVVDNITIDGSEIDLSSGDLTIDAAGGIGLDADDSGTISFKDGGTRYGLVQKSSDNFEIQSMLSDGDILFKGNDGGSAITALALDMSDAGAATLNNGLTLTDGNLTFASGHGIDFTNTGDNSHTMTTELFDDYEEGTYAYTITGSNSGSLNLRSGYGRGVYTKIGNWVHVNTRFETSSDNSIDGNIKWSLPFTMADPNGSDADAAVAPGYIRDDSMSTDARTGVYLLSESQAFVQYLFTREGVANSTVELATHNNTDGVMEGTISISYRTT